MHDLGEDDCVTGLPTGQTKVNTTPDHFTRVVILCHCGRMSPIPSNFMWIAFIAALIQAITTVIHVGHGRTTSKSIPHREVPNRLAALGLVVSVFTALSIAIKSYAWERRELGTLSFYVIRDELDATFFRVALFILDVAAQMILYFPAAMLLGLIIGSLVVGHLDRNQIYVHIATLVMTATASVLVVVAEVCIDGVLLIDWPFIAFLVIVGFDVALEIPVEQSSEEGSRFNTTANPDAGVLVVDSIGKRAYQSPSLGRALTVLGWTLAALGLSLGIIFPALYRDLVPKADFPLWVHPLLAFVALVPSYLLWSVGNVLLKQGRRHRHRIIPSLEELTGEHYLLYLRPFAIDSAMALPPDEAPGWLMRSPFELLGTHEEFLVRQFRGLGRIVAIGQPGELLPALGAERGYLPVDNWKDTVSRLIQGAHAVIMMAAPGPGTAWEFTEALRTATPTRLLLLVYGEEIYHAFREDAAEEYAARSSAAPDVNWPPLPQLPDIPPPAPYTKGLRWDFPFEGILSFDNQWRPQFTRFLPTVPRIRHVWTIRRLVRRELDPVLGPLSRLPPAPPLP